ncbi:FkbM family methyltransferase [Nocardia wallacei]|uniref:FkbM family methyltransferase n=1 Tax=Nocardia wallacei TaxID=480035 RepID=UPI002457CC0A|nr:FkbM family methyltransferase [Nocardia wallacei]
MPFEYLRGDADIHDGRSVAAVLAREAVSCAHAMALAAAHARGWSRVTAPYWMARRFGGQLGTPLDSDRVITQTWSTPGGGRARIALRTNQSDLIVLWEVFVHRNYELPEPISRLDTIVDIGANSGLASAYLAARYRPSTLLAIEPLAENAAVLRRNAALADAPWIVEQCAASSSDGELEFFVSGYWCTATAVPEVGEHRLSSPHRIEHAMPRPAVTVPARTVAALLDEHGIDRVDLMKIDIEGGELDLLRDRPRWLNRVDRLLIEIHDKYIDGAPVRAALAAAGLQPRSCPHLEDGSPPGHHQQLFTRDPIGARVIDSRTGTGRLRGHSAPR